MSAVGDECGKLAAWLRLIYCMLCGSLRWLGADNLSKSVRVEEGRKERLQKAGDRTREETQPKPEKIQLEDPETMKVVKGRLSLSFENFRICMNFSTYMAMFRRMSQR